MSDQAPPAEATDQPAPGASEPPAQGHADPASLDPNAEVARLISQLDDLRRESRKHEDRARTNYAAVKELDRLKQTMMSDAERATAEARADERSKVTREFGIRLVEATLRTAAVGRPINVDALVEGADLARFVGDDGEPDAVAIASWLERVAPRPEPNGNGYAGALDLGQGTQGTNPAALNDGSLEAHLRAALSGP